MRDTWEKVEKWYVMSNISKAEAGGKVVQILEVFSLSC